MSNRPNGIKCEACVFFELRPTLSRSVGRCQRFPVETQKNKGAWCGEFSPAPEPEPDPYAEGPPIEPTDEELEILTAPDKGTNADEAEEVS